ncbi:MATE family efflux transporter [Shewanella surugensis]|uniref:MATE family efflux transporter n=1 Tax=Shewanella surugensis TaxID=212020 RepID=A0ABT0LIW6_9GAMM|nr:MATE family efflux transporter [Shewanella surugensis]MCL1127657.1 hypothetical protein [Shewanella surugensis]
MLIISYLEHLKLSWDKYFHRTLILALPLMLSLFSQILLGIVDLLMVGQLGAVAVASVAFVNVLAPLLFALTLGLATAFLIKIAHAYGSMDNHSGAEEFRYAMICAVFLGVIQCVLLIVLLYSLGGLGQPEEVVAMTPPLSFLDCIVFYTYRASVGIEKLY